MSGRVLSAEEVEALAGLDCWDAELIPDLLATVVYGREQVLRLTRERDTLAEGCCVDCGGSGVGPDACDAGDHFTPSCHSCGGTGMSPTVRRVVKERDEARAEVERLRAELLDAKEQVATLREVVRAEDEQQWRDRLAALRGGT